MNPSAVTFLQLFLSAPSPNQDTALQSNPADFIRASDSYAAMVKTVKDSCN